MKSLFLYVIVTILNSNVLGNRPSNNTNLIKPNPFAIFLNKFHQNDYKINYERCELVRSDKSLGDFQIRTYKFNRTTPAINGSIFLTVDVGFNAEVVVQAYKFASNEYRLFPMHFQINLCEALASKVFGLDMLAVSGNIICPLLKGKKYYFYNFVPDESQFPPFVPDGRYLIEFQFIYHSKEFFVVNNYGSIERPIAIPDV